MRSTAGTAPWARNFTDVRRASPLLSWGGLRARLRDGALALAGRTARFAEPTFLRCLYLHYVYDDQVHAFRRLLSSLQRIGTFVSTETVVRIVAGERALDGRYFHLSADDGFDNIHRNAFPVLAELGIPAAFFLPTALVGIPDELLLERWWVRGTVRPTRTLEWSRARELHEAGFDIGSHTRHHVRLSEVSADPRRLAAEIEGSKRDIEDRLGAACRYMSWPFGTLRDIDSASLECIRGAGYEACFSAVRGKVQAGTTSRLTIPRHHFEPDWPWSHVRFFAAGGRERD